MLVLAVLTVSYASSLKAYLQQRSHIEGLKVQIAQRRAAIEDLEAEKQRWKDPQYVKQQARARFGYIMPGEKSFVVLDENGQPLADSSQLDDPDDVVREEPTAWWTTAWASVELAGDPPRETPPPADKIRSPATKIEPGSE